MKTVTIIGAGLAGLSAAAELAGKQIRCALVSAQVSERAQSVMAEGGINAALDLMGEDDSVQEHAEDTLRGGVYLADPKAVRELTEQAPAIVRHLAELGVPFTMDGDRLIQRSFGGQKKKRTAYCQSSTGKALMTAMIDEVRRCEDTWIVRYPHHTLEALEIRNGQCRGVRIRDGYTGKGLYLDGPVILAFGGPCGLFPGMTTGTTANDGNALATVFSQGVEAANLEFIQYHPTTAAIAGKRLLISEAARGEGGRLFVRRGGKRWYFMEERYPELGNLMPRDVISREMVHVGEDPACEDQVYLDLTVLSREVWKKKLPDLRQEVQHYLGIDPAKESVPVSPGIHFFMGGIAVDAAHRTNIPGLYAAGECACQYHGANRLGGNSLLGALYGGKRAAIQAAAELSGTDAAAPRDPEDEAPPAVSPEERPTPQQEAALAEILKTGMGIFRSEASLTQALQALQALREQPQNEMDRRRQKLAEAMLRSALAREESRGAHQRTDYPERSDAAFQKTTIARVVAGDVQISFRPIGDQI